MQLADSIASKTSNNDFLSTLAIGMLCEIDQCLVGGAAWVEGNSLQQYEHHAASFFQCYTTTSDDWKNSGTTSRDPMNLVSTGKCFYKVKEECY